MGAAARKSVQVATPRPPSLRVVSGGSSRRPSSGARKRPSGLQRTLCACAAIVLGAGVMRVALTARAAEASIEAWDLRAEVRAEEHVSRALEADRSALASPSRIEELASETLNMTTPSAVCYLEAPVPEQGLASSTAAKDGHVNAVSVSSTGAQDVVRAFVRLAATEAQVLLVGDMGLGSLR